MPVVKMRESEVRGKPGWGLSLKLCKEGLPKKRRPPGATCREKKKKLRRLKDCRDKTLMALGEEALGYPGL